MKHTNLYTLLLALSMSATTVTAAERSEAQMMAIAKAQLNNTTQAKALGKKTTATTVLKTVREDSQYAMYTTNDGSGYVIVARDDAYNPIIAYGTDAESQLPCCMKAMLNLINANLEARLQDGQTESLTGKDDATYEVVNPLMTTYWTQNNPYNLLCPTYTDGNRSTTGCVATATAMVMKYFRYPDSVQGEGYYTLKGSTKKYNVDINSTYQWDQMLDTYSSSATDEQKNAVAQLMYDCGLVNGLQYSSSGTGGSVTTQASQLHEVFKYAYVNHITKLYCTDYEWRQLIYDQIMAGCPLLTSGTDNSKGGHAFVMDGIDANGLVHINWGWGKTMSGYFDVLALTPSYGTKYNFDTNLGFICGLLPKATLDATDKPMFQPSIRKPASSATYTDNYNFSIKDGKLIMNVGSVYNNCPVTFKGYYGVRFENTDGVNHYDMKGRRSTGTFFGVTTKAFEESFSFGGFTTDHDQTPPDELKPGTYRVYLAAYDTEMQNPHPARYINNGAVYWLLTKADDGTLSISDMQYNLRKAQGIPTAIHTATSKAVSDNRYYDLQGRSYNTMPTQPGIYIVNGKKKLIR